MTDELKEIRVGRLFADPGKAAPVYGATIRIAGGRIVSVDASGDPATAGEGRHLVAVRLGDRGLIKPGKATGDGLGWTVGRDLEPGR